MDTVGEASSWRVPDSKKAYFSPTATPINERILYAPGAILPCLSSSPPPRIHPVPEATTSIGLIICGTLCHKMRG